MSKNDLISRSEAVRAVMCFDDDGSIRDVIYDLPAVDPEDLELLKQHIAMLKTHLDSVNHLVDSLAADADDFKRTCEKVEG